MQCRAHADWPETTETSITLFLPLRDIGVEATGSDAAQCTAARSHRHGTDDLRPGCFQWPPVWRQLELRNRSAAPDPPTGSAGVVGTTASRATAARRRPGRQRLRRPAHGSIRAAARRRHDLRPGGRRGPKLSSTPGWDFTLSIDCPAPSATASASSTPSMDYAQCSTIGHDYARRLRETPSEPGLATSSGTDPGFLGIGEVGQ